MKKWMPLLGLLLFAQFLHAQSPINLKMGALPTDKSKSLINEILGRVGNDLFVTRVSEYYYQYQNLPTKPNVVGKDFKNKLTLHLCRMDAQLKDLNSLDLSTLFPDEATWVKSAEILNGEIVVFAEQRIKSPRSTNLFIRRLDPKTLKPKSEPIQVASVAGSTEKYESEILIVSSYNNKYIGFIAVDPQVDNSIEVYRASMYSGNWEKISETKITLENKPGISVDNIILTNDGNFTVNSSGIVQNNLCYFSQTFDASAKETISGKYCLPGLYPNGTVVYGDSLRVNHFWTLYSQKPGAEPIGVLHYALSNDPVSMIELNPIALTTDQIQAFFKESKSDNVSKAKEKGNEFPLKEFSCEKAFVLKDGISILAVEQSDFHLGTLAGKPSDNTTLTDIVLICLKGNDVLWVKRIPKWQSYAGSYIHADFMGASFGGMSGLNNENYLLYNEKPEQRTKVIGALPWPSGKGHQITVVAFNGNGDVQLHSLLDKAEVNGYIIPESMTRANPDPKTEKEAAEQYTIIRNYSLGDRIGYLTLK